MRVIVDPGVLVSAVVSELGAPYELLRLWDEGVFELVTSPLLMDELRRALAYPDVEKRVAPERARHLLDTIRGGAIDVPDPSEPPRVTRGPKDDYLVALARAAGAYFIVSEDRDLLEADVRPPVVTPRELLRLLQPS